MSRKMSSKSAMLESNIDKIFGIRQTVLPANSASKLRTPDGHVVEVSHSEYIQDVTGTASFDPDSFNVNPGLVTTFPSLSAIARNFESYVIKEMVFEYRPRVGPLAAFAGSNTSEGVVMMNVQYDVADPFFNNYVDMLNYYGTQSVPASQPFFYSLDVSRGSKGGILPMRYVRTNSAYSNTDIRLYDYGRFNIATSRFPETQTCGELWVHYKVLLYKQNIFNVLGNDYPYFHIRGSSDFSTTNYYGTLPVVRPGSTLVPSISGGALVLPRATPVGNYMVTWFWQGQNGSVDSPTVSLSSNMSFLLIFRDGASGTLDPGSYTSNVLTQSVAFSINTVPVENSSVQQNQISLTVGTLPVAPSTYMDCILTPIVDGDDEDL